MKVFDLSQPLYNACPGWPTYALTAITYEKIVGNDGYTAERIDFNSHTGTHLDAPFHFFPDGATIDEIPLERFIGRALIVNLDGIAARTGIGETHLKKYLPRIQPDDIVLLNTGWHRKRAVSAEYYHDWPYLTGEGAELLKERKIKGVGIDGMSLGGWYEGTGRPCHEALLSSDIWILEEIVFPDELLSYETCNLTAVPLKLKGFGGSPTRAYATVE
ncbi:MAG: cyclase family protein [Synergistaceae bacterium]|jgi:kynurenine formamidase|nr:cyclase family protein [Synergistaceae bacterium]